MIAAGALDSVAETPRIQATGLSWSAGSRFVLLELELKLRAGVLAVLTGANGAGKTSLLRLLHGSARPAAGTIAIEGVPLSAVQPAWLAQKVAMIGHKPGLYFDLSALENLRLFAALAGRPMDDAGANALLERVGIRPPDRRRPVRHFSRGMKQRTGLARVLASGADIWLLDEPSTGLDQQGREMLADLVGEARDGGAAVLVITHDPEVRALADRRLDLRQGRLHEVDP